MHTCACGSTVIGVAVIGVRVAVIGVRVAVIGVRVAVIGVRVAVIGVGICAFMCTMVCVGMYTFIRECRVLRMGRISRRVYDICECCR